MGVTDSYIELEIDEEKVPEITTILATNGIGVITSYSIHYTKLYDISLARGFLLLSNYYCLVHIINLIL